MVVVRSGIGLPRGPMMVTAVGRKAEHRGGENFYPAETGDGSIQANIESLICSFRGHQVMIDRDIAMLYGVETKALNQAVKRNIERFPERFRFQLSVEETSELVTVCDRFKSLKHTTTMHDRFMIIDGAVLYHIGASLKDLGKKCFAFEVLDAAIIPAILQNL